MQHLCSDPVPLKGHKSISRSISIGVKEIEKKKRKFVTTKSVSTECLQIAAVNNDMKHLVNYSKQMNLLFSDISNVIRRAQP